MTETIEQPQAAEVVVRRRRLPSLIWIIPIVAAVIAAWLAVKAVNDRGPVITIRFDSATGLEAGKTKIRYRDVDIGLVEAVRLDEDLTHVLVSARMDRRAAPFLVEGTQLWVVRARVAAGEVSGLGTLFSGAYIALAPGQGGTPSDHFIGQETPPALTGDQPGRTFILKAKRLGSLDVGSPVYHRQIQVGRVISYRLSDTSEEIELGIFIEAPHHERVRAGTRFWNADGFDFALDANGLRVDSESLLTIISGGIAFALPDPAKAGEIAGENSQFILYPNRRASMEPTHQLKQRYLLYFNESVRGLVAGAPVEFRGIRVGQVVSVELEFDTEKMEFRIPVVIELEPERIRLTGDGKIYPEDLAPKLIEKGLTAQLKQANLLTGQLAIALSLESKVPRPSRGEDDPYPRIPTIPTPFEELSATVTRIVKKLDDLPLDRIASGVERDLASLDRTLKAATSTLEAFDGTLNGLKELTGNLDRELAPAAKSAIEEMQRSLQELRANFGSDSPLSSDARKALEEFSKAARGIRDLTDYLERHPESLLRGKKGTAP